MAQFHFVEDYEKHVAALLASHPLDEAMSLAVGGGYEAIGRTEAALLKRAGLRNGMSVVDIGCGSGRLASILGEATPKVHYIGLDIVQSLLDYAATRTPKHFRFVLNRALSLPVGDASADIICAFSVFTHLLHQETYLYMEDARRALRPNGCLVFSFLEFAEPLHWAVFERTVADQRGSTNPHLNMFIERQAIELWAQKLGYRVEGYVSGGEAVDGSDPLGQSTAILRCV